MPVVCSENGQFATVDHLEGRDEIKLTKDKTGQHHFIPLSWVSSVDDKVHVDRPGDQAMKEWKTAPKDGGQGQSQGQSQTSEHDESRGTNEKRDNKMDVGDKKPQKNQQNNSGNAPRSTNTNQNDNNTKR